MPQPSSSASNVPPCLSPESAQTWERLCNYVRHTERRRLLVVRHNSPRLPRELPPLLATMSDRPLVAVSVSDAEPDPMVAAMKAAPGGQFPAGCLLSITGAEDLAVSAPDNSRAALFEFARRLDLRRDQFVPGGGVVIVWATARVFDALAEHALNFLSMSSAVLELRAADDIRSEPILSSAVRSQATGSYHLPPLPSDAPDDLRAALAAFEELAIANELYLQGGPQIAHALARFDAARDCIETGFATAVRYADLEPRKDDAPSASDPVRDFARALVIAFPDAGAHLFDLRVHPAKRIASRETQVRAARLLGNRAAEGRALGNLGLAHAALGEARKAIEYYEQVLVITREIGDRRGEGNALGNLGNAHNDLGNTSKAIEYHEQALVISREIGDQRGEGQDLGNLGNAHAVMGHARKAIEFYEQDLRIVRDLGDRLGEGQVLGNLGLAHAALGDARKAIDFHEMQLVIAREIGDKRSEGNALGNLGLAHAALGDARKAIEFYDKELETACEIGDQRGQGNALWNAALSFKRLGEPMEALRRARAALAIYEAIEDPIAERVRAALSRWEAEG